MEIFKQGDEKLLCTIISISDNDYQLIAHIDSEFFDIRYERGGNWGLRYSTQLFENFIQLIEVEVFEFYEVFAQENADRMTEGYHYFLELIT